MRTHKRSHKVNAPHIKQFNHKNGIKKEILLSLNATISLASITCLGELMSILVDGWTIVATLQDLVSSSNTTIMPTYRRRMACLQNTQHLNFRHTTPNKTIDTQLLYKYCSSKKNFFTPCLNFFL